MTVKSGRSIAMRRRDRVQHCKEPTTVQVRLGSNSDLGPRNPNVRFALVSRHRWL